MNHYYQPASSSSASLLVGRMNSSSSILNRHESSQPLSSTNNYSHHQNFSNNNNNIYCSNNSSGPSNSLPSGDTIQKQPPFVISLQQKEGTKELLTYCVRLRDFRLVDKYISSNDTQPWEISKCQLMYKQHNMMEVMISELFRLKGYERRADVINMDTRNNNNLTNLYNEVEQGVQDLKNETLKLKSAFEIAQRKHLEDIYGANPIFEIDKNVYSRHQTPVEQLFCEFFHLAEKMLQINREVIKTIINDMPDGV